jgi:acetate kinase
VRIAVLNAGSATVKAALAEIEGGAAARSGTAAVRVLARSQRTWPAPEERDAMLADLLAEVGAKAASDDAGAADGAHVARVDAVAHRVVHGGKSLVEPTVIDAAVERELSALSALAPLHNPPALACLSAARRALPERPMIAVFDTAFHTGRAPESLRYALPWDLADSLGIVRYGFHGIAHASLVASLASARGCEVEHITAVTLQLGAGCSACAVAGGRSRETSMGFSPLEGLVMATRAGDIDASVVLELVSRGMSVDEVRDLLTRRSGLAGLAGDADLRGVLVAERAGEPRARVAVALFVRRIVACVGAYLTLLDGEGAVVFGGGIGTGSAEIRRRVAAGLAGAWNVHLDAARNERGAPGAIAAPGARDVYVFETDEERAIALAASTVLRSV